MSPQQECPLCAGTGWKEVQVNPRRVSRCDCQVGLRTDRLLAQARIPARYEHCELSNFEPDYDGANRSLISAKLMAGRFVEEYPLDENQGLLLVGSIGVGKTHLAVGLLKELIAQRGVPCLFYDYRELLKEIQNSYNASVQTTEMEVLRPVFETEVLVLDELGAVKPTEWVWDTVSHILNTRYNDRRTTIITTNYPDAPPGGMVRRDSSQAQLARSAAREETLGDRIGERMRSRLGEMCRKVEMQGEDFRQRVRSASFR
jgi:DNA replication protein DnaC